MNDPILQANFDQAHPSAGAQEVPLLLIADTDHDFCKILTTNLEHLGYRFKCVGTVPELQQELENLQPNAILMDLAFGEQSLSEMVKTITDKLEITCPIIYMSKQDNIDTRLESVRKGGAAFLYKSFNLINLKFVLDSIVPLQKSNNLKVLIIDDDKIGAEYCAAILEHAGIKVSCLDSPLNIFDYIVSFEPDVILLDLYMPKIDGFEMAQVIRQHHAFASIPIVIMSSETDVNKQFRMRSIGADDFILKPFKPHHLVDTVLNRIQRSQLTKRMIYTDGLTGLMMFPKVKDQIFNLMDSCLRYNLDFSIALIDLDFFKQINDKYGHLVGDQMLRDFAEFLLIRVRKSDIVTRYGGEEFAIVFPYTNGENTIRALNSIRESYAKHVNHHNVGDFKLTFSAGIASINRFQDLESLLAAADRALYKAKEAGRNQIELANDGSDPVRLPIQRRDQG